jgi:glutathione S-transferase
MLLYDSQVSGNCYEVRLLLAHLGLRCERREVDVIDRTNRDELLGDLKAPPAQAELDARRSGGEAALDALERQLTLGPYLVEDRYTIADVALYAYTHIAHEARFDLAGRPATRAWLARVAAEPGHIPITA